MSRRSLPARAQMIRAVTERDRSFEGLFVFGVTSTGVACRPGCPARTPRVEHLRFHPDLETARAAGFRPCRRCRPERTLGAPPDWLAPLFEQLEAEPDRRLTAADLRGRGLSPERVRRWFQAQHGESFAAWQRRRRVARAAARVADGQDLLAAGLEAGFASDSGFREAFAAVVGQPPGRARREASRPTWLRRLPSPLGPLLAAAGDDGLCLLEFADEQRLPGQLERLARQRGPALAPGDHPHLATLADELAAYFAGKGRDFSVPRAAHGTAFQREVWERLVAIPYGTTVSYDALARDLGRPGAQRAVGQANGRNPLAIVVPCHRVVRSDGQLSGYAGGVRRKRFLLELEGLQLGGEGDEGDDTPGQGALFDG